MLVIKRGNLLSKKATTGLASALAHLFRPLAALSRPLIACLEPSDKSHHIAAAIRVGPAPRSVGSVFASSLPLVCLLANVSLASTVA